MDQQNNDILELIRIVLKWRKPVIVVTIIAAIGSAAFSWFFMPNFYKSSVNFYPSSPIMNDRQVLYSTSLGEIEINYFGSADDVDRILTLANTSSTIDYIINTHHLIEHYDYDSTKELSRYKTKKRFLKNYRAVETEYGAIEISVWDQDKNVASDMANHIAATIDENNKKIILRDRLMVIENFKTQVSDKEGELAVLTDSIESARQNNLSADKLMIIESKLQNSISDLNQNRKILEQYQTSADQNFSTIHITEEAYPAIRKDKPVRSLIVIAATIGAFIFMILLALITENYKKIKLKLSNA